MAEPLPDLPPLPALPTGLFDLDALLPGGGLPGGAVVELVAPRGLGMSTSLALSACASAQRRARVEGDGPGWCAFVDATGSLHAPGLLPRGVAPERLLVVRPPCDALGQVALRVARSRQFAVVVVDMGGVPGAMLTDSLGPWVNTVRRLAGAVAGTATTVLLLTHREAARPLPMPSALRIELSQEQSQKLLVRVGRYRELPSEWYPCAFSSAGPFAGSAARSS